MNEYIIIITCSKQAIVVTCWCKVVNTWVCIWEDERGRDSVRVNIQVCLFYFANLRFILSILRGSCKSIGGVDGIERWKIGKHSLLMYEILKMFKFKSKTFFSK